MRAQLNAHFGIPIYTQKSFKSSAGGFSEIQNVKIYQNFHSRDFIMIYSILFYTTCVRKKNAVSKIYQQSLNWSRNSFSLDIRTQNAPNIKKKCNKLIINCAFDVFHTTITTNRLLDIVFMHFLKADFSYTWVLIIF